MSIQYWTQLSTNARSSIHFHNTCYRTCKYPNNITWVTVLLFYFNATTKAHFITSDKGGGKCVCPHSSVCLLAKLLKNGCMDLDEMLRVDRCWDKDELINFWAWSKLQSECRNRIAFSDIVRATTRNFITSGKSHLQVLDACRCRKAATRGFKMVLFTASRGNNFVGGKSTCAPPSALLVIIITHKQIKVVKRLDWTPNKI